MGPARPRPGTGAARSQRRRCVVHQVTADSRTRQAGPLPTTRPAPPGEVLLVGAHGGAGVTTLAGLLRPAWDMGAVRRPGPGQGPLRPAGRPVVLVARSTASAAARAVTATGLLAAQGVQIGRASCRERVESAG